MTICDMDVSENFIPIAFLFVCIFGVLFLYTLHELQKIRRLKKSGNLVSGKIVDISKIGYPDGPIYSPIIEFDTLEGQTICFTSNEGRATSPTIGESVVVLYDLKRPDEAIEFNETSEKKTKVFVYVFASIVLLIFIAILAKAS